MRRRVIHGLLLTLGALPAVAQTSTSWDLRESVVNAGGHPTGGAAMQSASWSVRLDALGEAVPGPVASSASFTVESGFVGAYPPPREVAGLRFAPASRVRLAWAAERSAGTYGVYRGPTTGVAGGGSCLAGGLSGLTYDDPAVPAPGEGSFYLVTARNRLFEEGTKGARSDGTLRPHPAPCP